MSQELEKKKSEVEEAIKQTEISTVDTFMKN